MRVSPPTTLPLRDLEAFIEHDRKIHPDSPDCPNLVRPGDLNPRESRIADKFIENCTVTLGINGPQDRPATNDPRPDSNHLEPVVGQLRRSDWRFPFRCIAFRPQQNIAPLYHFRSIHPNEIAFLFHDEERRPFIYRLVSRNTRDNRRNLQYTGPNGLFTNFSVFIEEVDSQRRYPVRVMFKKTENQMLRLHTVLIPLAVMELIVLDSDRPRSDN